MAALRSSDTTLSSVALRDRDHAEGYVASVCFKTGPPRLIGVELEWTVHDDADPARRVPADRLARALGPHAPRSLCPDSPNQPLPRGGLVTLEPGGQVEISTPPDASLSRLLTATDSDHAHLVGLLAAAGLTLGDAGTDAHRAPRRLLDTPRYAAMQAAFDRRGPAGATMMCSTAGLQVCLDAGLPDRVASRWAALHALGPVLIAAFANSPRLAGRATGWASTRMRSWYGIDPARTRPVPQEIPGDPARDWARYAMRADLLCVPRPADDWTAPPGVTFGDWVSGAVGGQISRDVLPATPTTDDLDYHLGTLFPPVRPRGYLEVRYLDAQPAGGWMTPVAVLAALFAAEETVDELRQLAAPAAGKWVEAARSGLADPVIAAAAADVLRLAAARLDSADLTPQQHGTVTGTLARRIADADSFGRLGADVSPSRGGR